VGGRIVAEVLVGLLQRDPNSYLYLDPAWKPAPPIAQLPGQFTFADLLKFAGAALLPALPSAPVRHTPIAYGFRWGCPFKGWCFCHCIAASAAVKG
jgi:hypothetical protein